MPTVRPAPAGRSAPVATGPPRQFLRLPLRRAAVAAALVATLPLTACGASSTGAAQAPVAAAWHGIEPDPVPPRPHFVLTDTSGAPYDFAARTTRRPTLLYFGYTGCPDECPTAMADIATALRRSPPALRAATTVVFVTTDPARDTPALLRSWLDRYDTGFIGLTGTPAQVDAAQRAAGVRPATRGGATPTASASTSGDPHAPGTADHSNDSSLGYAVEHTTMIFAYDVDDRLPVLYPPSTTAGDLAADLPLLAKPPGQRPAR